MKIEDATLKDLVFSLILILFAGGASIFANVQMQHKVGIILTTVGTVMAVLSTAITIYRKTRPPLD